MVSASVKVEWPCWEVLPYSVTVLAGESLPVSYMLSKIAPPEMTLPEP